MKRWLFFILFIGWMVYISAFPPSMLPNETSKTQPEDLLQESKSILVENTPSIRDLSNITEEEINQKTISFEPLHHCIYYAPFFIFQATYGEIASDYYLFSLNTQTGELVKIHKGFHGDFWIKGDRFTFRHTDHIYQCTIPNWKQLAEIKMQTWDDMIANREGKLNENKTPIRQSYSCELPPALRLLDWEYIYCVMEGSFTKSNQKEILFISGRKPTYDIAVYQWSDKKMIAIESLGRKSQEKEWLNIASKNDENMVNFRQAIFEDTDEDGCLEVFINSVYAAWMYLDNPLLYLDFSKSVMKKNFQMIETNNLSDTEILRFNDEMILIGNAFSDNNRELEAYRISQRKDEKLISLTEINPIPFSMKSHIKSSSHQHFNNGLFFGPVRKHLSFARTGRNLSDAGNPVEIRSKKWPKLPVCLLYNAANPDLTPREKLYHSKRNLFLKQFFAKLDTGWNPFAGYTFPEDKSDYIDKNHAWKLLKQVLEVIPIFEQDRVFPILVLVMNQEDRAEENSFDRTVLCLYNQNWELQDCHSIEVNDRMHDLASLTLPLPQEKFIFANYNLAPRYSAFHAILIQREEIQETVAFTNISGSDVFYYQNQWLVHIRKYNHYLATNWGDGGNGVGYFFDYIIDPLTKEIKDTDFSDFFQFKLVYLYYCYHFFHYRGSTTLIHDNSENQIIPILERYEKNIYYHELAPMVEDDDGER